MSLISTVCPECKATIKLDDTKAFGFCMSCGSKILLSSLSTGKQNGIGIEQMIKNYAALALNAKNAGNNEQCEDYCNKIIELDATNAPAWMLKGSAAGWQSTLSSLRIEEMLLCFQKGIQFSADASTKETNKKMAVEDLKNVLLAMINVQCERFIKWPDAEESQAIVNVSQYVVNAIGACNSNIAPFDIEQVTFPGAVTINNAAVKAERGIIQEYQTDNDGHPGDYAFKRFIEKMGYVYNVYNLATVIADKDYANNITRYDNMINNQNLCINARSYSGTYVGDLVGWYYQPNLSLNDQAVAARKKIISDLNSKKTAAQRKQREEKESAQRQRNQQYWAAHTDERERLQNEKRRLEGEIRDLRQQLSKADSLPAITDLKDEIETLRLERNALGMFKGRQKKEMDARIADNEAKLENLIKSSKDPLQRQIDAKTSRIRSIDNELNRNH